MEVRARETKERHRTKINYRNKKEKRRRKYYVKLRISKLDFDTV